MNYVRPLELTLVATSALAALLLIPVGSEPSVELPHRAPRPEYLGSEGCQMCHPGQHASWHRSYHRTMSRRPGEVEWDGVSGPRLPSTLEDEHFSFRLKREGSNVVARGPDLHQAAQNLYAVAEQARSEGNVTPSAAAIQRALSLVSEAERPVALVTGSHHYLAFWLSAGENRELRQLPFVYHLAERKWAPRSRAFLEPPDAPPHIPTWNSNCIQCHAVAGEPRESEWRDERGALHVRYDSRVAELGISCEACHGPGRPHADHYRSPLRRWPSESERSADLIVNPGTLDRAKGSAICGQCHAYFVPRDEDQFWEIGYVGAFAVGGLREASRVFLQPDAAESQRPAISREASSIFWPDGTMRVGGREYAGLVASACYLRGQGRRQLGCVSCHSMHDSDPSDQLTREAARDANTPCADCHEMPSEHSGHAPGSIGDSCVNCHMPKTTYALLQGIRSHRIQIPEPHRTDVPSACALCHVDRPLAWFSQEPTQSPEAAGSARATRNLDAIGVGVRGALAGDAAERAIYAAALGSEETQKTVGKALSRALLERLARDPYHAVRRIAERGLAELSGPIDEGPSPLAAAIVERLEGQRNERDVVISE